jgi:hypothetical protein
MDLAGALGHAGGHRFVHVGEVPAGHRRGTLVGSNQFVIELFDL